MKGDGEAGGGSQGGGGAHSGAIGDDDNAARRPSGGRAAGWGSAGHALALRATAKPPAGRRATVAGHDQSALPHVGWGEIFTFGAAAPHQSDSRISFIASLRCTGSSRSMNSTPSRWSVSCWTQRASCPVPSRVTGSPYMLKPLATTPYARFVGKTRPGKDRQPSSSVSSSADRVSDGLIRWPTWSSTW